MKNNETEKIRKRIITTLNLGGYIKGYGNSLCRLMDSKHNPLMNFDKKIKNSLELEGVIILEKTVYRKNIANN